jgi:hypothetical protein
VQTAAQRAQLVPLIEVWRSCAQVPPQHLRPAVEAILWLPSWLVVAWTFIR